MTRRFALLLASAALLSGCSSTGDGGSLFGYAAPQPGVLAGAPDLQTDADVTGGTNAVRPAVQPLMSPPSQTPAPLVAEPQIRQSRSLPAARGAAMAPTSIASGAEDVERERMIASALAPASTSQKLGELSVGSNGNMILPEGRNLEIIDIAPIRSSMTDANDLPPGL